MTLADAIEAIEILKGKASLYSELLSCCDDIEEGKVEVFSNHLLSNKDRVLKEVKDLLNKEKNTIEKEIEQIEKAEVKLGTSKRRPRKSTATNKKTTGKNN